MASGKNPDLAVWQRYCEAVEAGKSDSDFTLAEWRLPNAGAGNRKMKSLKAKAERSGWAQPEVKKEAVA